MPENMYLYLLILCGIWSHTIIGTFADEEIKESSESDVLVREKRVINRIPGEDVPVEIKTVPYIVHIKYDMRIHCVASILSQFVVITSASCIQYDDASKYLVISASPRSNRGTRHVVTDIRKHYGNHPGRPFDGIALLTVDPFFVYSSYTKHIELHSEPLLSGMLGTVSGWGFNFRDQERGTIYPMRLRSIQVPIMAHQECIIRYRPYIKISEMNICTFDPHKSCCHNDGGAPLVVNGYLAGVYLWSGLTGQYNSSYPDVFIMLQHSAYNQWIRTNVENINLHFSNHRH